MRYRMCVAFMAAVLCHFFNTPTHAHTEAELRAELVTALAAVMPRAFAEEQFNHKNACSAYILPPQERLMRWDDLRGRMRERESLAAGEWFFWQNALVLTKHGGTDADLPYYITAILRIETNFGENLGTEPALRTFYEAYKRDRHAHPSRAANILKRQIIPLLRYARETCGDPCAIYGSRAGAIGLPQFMPASLPLARDGDEDGIIDLVGSMPDAAASIANFLRMNGWGRRSRITVLKRYCGGKYAWLVDEYARNLKERVEKGHQHE